MHPLWIVLIGVFIVVGGVLVLRLHAFLALVLAALVVGALTPPTAIEKHTIEKDAISWKYDDATAMVVLGDTDAHERMQYLVLRIDPTGTAPKLVGELTIARIEKAGDDATKVYARIERRGQFQSLEAGDFVVHPSTWRAAKETADKTVGERVAVAFGNTCGKIGILIAMAAIIGKCLLESGAADRIVRSALRVTGERGAPVAFVGSGFLLGIPVFFDTVFYLMIPLGKAMRMRTGRNYLLYVLTIVAGGTMAHSLVPPTPGPLFVAEELRVDLGLMILAGCAVGLVSSTTGFCFAQFVNRRNELPLRESPDFSLAELEELSNRDESQLPPLALAVLPIVLPVVLIAGYTVLKAQDTTLPAGAMSAAATLGNKNIALVIAAVIAMVTLVWQRRTDLRELAGSVQAALASGGMIILITAAGGAFGGIVQQTGIAGLMQHLPAGSPLVVIVLAFLITMAVRTAQGSATVAMITAVGILSGLVESGQLGCHPVFLALAIGCGSKPIAWMNDSGFWVICKMSGMTETEGLRYVTTLTALMGLAGLLATMAGAVLVPA
jgi:GntP family gluconate:H+ symporter